MIRDHENHSDQMVLQDIVRYYHHNDDHLFPFLLFMKKNFKKMKNCCMNKDKKHIK